MTTNRAITRSVISYRGDHHAERDDYQQDHRAERDNYGERSARRAADRFAARASSGLSAIWAFSLLRAKAGRSRRSANGWGSRRASIGFWGGCLEMLAEDGWLFRVGDRWEAGPAQWDDVEPGGLLRQLLEHSRTTRRSSLWLITAAGVLRPCSAGTWTSFDPLSGWFARPPRANLRQSARRAPSNRLVAGTIAKGIESLPADRIVRIVEIGAGTGGTTAHVLSKLPRGRCEYLFTDVSSLFINHARERFREHRFIQYGALDIERDPALSGFAPHQFDIVLAANVLHATPDLKRSLAHARQLLAPAAG